MLSFPYRVGLALTLVASAAWTSSPVLAASPDEVEPTIVVFELHYATRTFDKTSAYAKGVEEQITRVGGFAVLAHADAEKRVRAQIPQSPAVSLAAQADDVRKAVKEAEDIFFGGDTKTALDRLKDANEKLRKILDGLSLADSIRKEYVSTQMLLMLIFHRSRQEDKARAVATDLVKRVGEDAAINEDTYHPEAVAIYRDVYASLAAMRVGKIAIASNPPGADIFVNGTRQDQKTPATIEGLFPGQVLVQIRKDGRSSLVKDVVVDEGTTRQLSIDLEFESALAFDGARFGLVFRDDADRKSNLPRFAAKLGAIVNADRVAFVGLGERGQKTQLEAYLARAPAEELIRGTTLAARSDVFSKNRVDQVAAFLVFGDAPEMAYKPWYTNSVGWVLTGVGLVGLGVGGAMYVAYVDDKAVAECNPRVSRCESVEARDAAKESAETERTLAYVGFGVGAVGIISGILAFNLMRDEDVDAPVKSHVPAKDAERLPETVPAKAAERLPEDAPAKGVAIVPAPFLLPGGGGIGASLRF
jgi:hypothetical protein